MSDNKKTARPPMLYITQPNYAQAEAKMQTTYRSSRETKPNKKVSLKKEMSQGEKERRKALEVKPVPQDVEEQPVREISNEVAEAEEQGTNNETMAQEQTSTISRRRRFRDMNVEEKVEYFISLPPQVPKMKCEVITEEGSHRGLIETFEDGVVGMKTIRRPYEAFIEFDTIRDIRLLGF
ncbi:hypothetical protein N781_15530 [Pontibacillus halophilus JSM 076056 = DSM 19796]|uniref:Spore coat protein CotO n=1 Tax=Pontibacillus halophilus JSM 076056 = DSM 19796 TaxID=1385510 RepID=A0A0A5GNG7_9BACI|nr:CotO family spore coat protein [Pontibacillus halophilus]KGX92798.1 hypothetical protein N781_15530 [Pontibacillus halophilus JSM 076056 = DSM 19796]